MSTEEELESLSLLGSVTYSEDYSKKIIIPPLQKTKLTAFKYILRIIFLPFLLWDILKFVTRLIFGNLTASLVLQSQYYTQENSDKDYSEQLTKFANSELVNDIGHKRYTLETHDHAKIDTVSFTQDIATKNSGIYIIHCNGAGETFEPEMINLALAAKDLACTVVGFNYRGTGYSSPNAVAFRDLVNDAIAVAQDLLDKGVDPENIIIHGFSLGGVVASYVNKQLLSLVDNHKKSFYIYADRPPSSFTKFVVGFARRTGQLLKAYFNSKSTDDTIENLDGYTENPFWKIIGAISYPFVKFVLNATEWDADASDTFQETPIHHRSHTVVKSSAEIRHHFHPADDHITSDYASMHRALKKERLAIKHKLTNDEEMKEAQTIIRKASRFSAQSVGHWQAPENLVSKNISGNKQITINAKQHFQCFVRATHPTAYVEVEIKEEERILENAWKAAGYGATQ